MCLCNAFIFVFVFWEARGGLQNLTSSLLPRHVNLNTEMNIIFNLIIHPAIKARQLEFFFFNVKTYSVNNRQCVRTKTQIP